MKKFDIPHYFRSPIISKVKAKRKLDDPRKQDFSPTEITIGNTTFIISRHFGFCYGVENAIEKSYNAIQDNPDKRIFLLSEMIHNPDVNDDLISQGVKFIQDTDGTQIIPWSDISGDDIVIIPAFGTTLETKALLEEKGIDTVAYNTTCPFVEKVWNRSSKLGQDDHTIIIHGKKYHEETKATFSHSKENGASIVVLDMAESEKLADFITGKRPVSEFVAEFGDSVSEGFDPEKDLLKVGVVNQTTMLATETQGIADFFKQVMIEKYGEENVKSHFADTRDTLCYATNDNQSATIELLNTSADVAFVVGGYNSSNTSHLVELLEDKFPTYFIRNKTELIDENNLRSFDIHSKTVNEQQDYLSQKDGLRVIITSGASCPDVAVDEVIQRLLELRGNEISFDDLEF
jgi:4-hydroxy-3-methylbut-2-enyl diphosphate reductase